ncbi:toxic anion resistance protein [Hydromonas duriensis]|uniref:Toxic anion resistance protein TelA n=1 Tax=Hydromonas duriensis TaxID=1527608 RepID=A0A4R6Y6R4_9BURK|nr:toxic anion resistance protein [Hydromonas duriensis]TDR27743.1 toxic anion resistance protein TelA [Hydromonas duriensis]
MIKTDEHLMQTTLSSPTSSLLTSISVNLPITFSQKVPDIVTRFDISKVSGPQIVTFGQEPVSAFSRHLDEMLEQLTKADSPVLFELFRKISKGIKDMDLPSLEIQIREKLKGGWLSRVFRGLGFNNSASFLENATDEVRGLLKSKASSLLDLIRPMEAQVADESSKLINEINRLGEQAAAYRNSILDLGVYVVAGRDILQQVKTVLSQVEASASASQDPVQIRDAKDMRTKVELFENRVLTLENAYAKAPVDLESIGIAQNAGLMTLADTVSSSQVEFNDIKSALLRLNATFQIRSLQQLNNMRRELRADLQKYSLQQLEGVAVDATRSAADAQLENAQLLLGVAQTLGHISEKVDAERQQNVVKIANTRALLKQVQEEISTLNS